MGLDKRYLFLATVLAFVAFGLSLYLYPEWNGSWGLLIVAVVIGVVSFIANFRQAFEKKEGSSMSNTPDQPTSSETHSGGIHVERSTTGRDNINVSGGNSTVNNLTINLGAPDFLRPASAPPRPSLIVGREDDMKELKSRLGATKDGTTSLQILTAIKGWPGVGKTTIASALAYDPEIMKLFPDGVLWTSLGESPNILSEMATWGRALGTEEIVKANSVEEAHTVLSGLLRNKRMLLIIDDVWNKNDALPFKAGGVGCATLITTRLDGVASDLAPTAESIYRLQVLKDKAALELLGKLAPMAVQMHPNECLVLVKELEGLPLALQVAGRLLHTEANSGFGVTELIDALRAGAKLLAAAAPADRTDLVTQTTPTIAALLQKSVDRLDESTKEYYAYLGVFAPQPATFGVDAMKFVWEMDDPKPTIRTLVDRGLLEYVPELDRYWMHALLVMLAKTLLTPDE
jgi:NB-ARC domain-containing protein